MKKLIALLLSAVSLFAFLGCSAGGVNKDVVRVESTVLTESQVDASLISSDAMRYWTKRFLNITEEHPNGNMGIRQPYSKNEADAAELLFKLAEEIGGGEGGKYNVQSRSFTENDNTSYNIIATKKASAETSKQVIFLANFDSVVNEFTINNDSSYDKTTSSTGAMENATGCALLLALMDCFKDSDFDFNLVFLFFGAGNESYSGAHKYYDTMTQTERNNTLLTINVRRFGGDYIYAYSDEVETAHNKFIYSSAKRLKVNLTKIPRLLPVVEVAVSKKLPYTNWAMPGGHLPFFSGDMNVVNIFSGNISPVYACDIESKAYPFHTMTYKDTYEQLENNFSSYKKQMSQTAILLKDVLESGDFVSVMQKSAEEYKNYSWAVHKTTANLILVALIAVVGIILIVTAKKLEKKYPVIAKKINFKIAVFGKEYEDIKPDDVFIEVENQNKKPPVNPFDY